VVDLVAPPQGNSLHLRDQPGTSSVPYFLDVDNDDPNDPNDSVWTNDGGNLILGPQGKIRDKGGTHSKSQAHNWEHHERGSSNTLAQHELWKFRGFDEFGRKYP
jgi:hypothetical protein